MSPESTRTVMVGAFEEVSGKVAAYLMGQASSLGVSYLAPTVFSEIGSILWKAGGRKYLW